MQKPLECVNTRHYECASSAFDNDNKRNAIELSQALELFDWQLYPGLELVLCTNYV